MTNHEVHEVTGRDYRCVTSYAFLQGLGRGKRDGFWRNRFWSKRHEDEHGRVWWTTRWPSRTVGRLHQHLRRMQPVLCRIGIHDTWDVTEIDGSVIEGFCGDCKVSTKPRKPHPPDPERIADLDKFDKMAEEYEAALERYWAGGPCPECGKTEGHEPSCWNAD